MEKMKIIVDGMGGDNAPDEIVKGAIMAAEELGVKICLVGQGDVLLEAVSAAGYKNLPAGVEITHASEVVAMEDDPAAVMREKKDSSIAVGLRLLEEGHGDAFVTAGNTGALLAGSTLVVKRIKGIRRAALAPLIPTKTGKALLIDCGANVECAPEYLLQFSYMGAYYAENVMGIKKARVGLLNIGTESTKGAPLQKEAWKLLNAAGESGNINFVGNVESRDVMFGVCDVIVADGYSGNIMLKTVEGMGLLFNDMLKGIFKKNILSMFAAMLVGGGIKDLRKRMDYNETGGAPLLGISKPVIKAHGSSKALTMRSAVLQAKKYVESGIIDSIIKNMSSMQAE